MSVMIIVAYPIYGKKLQKKNKKDVEQETVFLCLFLNSLYKIELSNAHEVDDYNLNSENNDKYKHVHDSSFYE